MTTTDLKKYINQNDKIPFILEKCGCGNIKLNTKGEYSNYSASQPDGDNKQGVVINCNDYLNYCSYSRGISFDEQKDLIDFIQSAKHIGFVDAVKWLHQLLEIPISFSKKSAQQPVNKQDEIINMFKKYKTNRKVCDVRDIKYIDPKEFRDYSKCIYIDLFREGIINKTIKKFGLMYDWQHHRSVFIHRDWLTGLPVGANERTSIKNYDILGVSKYYLTPGYNKTRQLYGLYENRPFIEKDRYCVLFEAEKSVCKRDSRNDPHGLGISGKSLSSEQVRLILGLNVNEVIIALDNDVNIEDVLAICEKFYGLRTISFIRDKHGWLGKKDSPADADDKIYRQLFKERIIYNEKLHQKYLKSCCKP